MTNETKPKHPPEGYEQFLVVVGWADGKEPMMLRGRVSADTGYAPPDPTLTRAEMQKVAFAAKSALLKALRERGATSVSKPITGGLCWVRARQIESAGAYEINPDRGHIAEDFESNTSFKLLVYKCELCGCLFGKAPPAGSDTGDTPTGKQGD